MAEKTTKELEEILKSTHPRDAGKYLRENLENMDTNEEAFYDYMNRIIKEKQLKKQTIFLDADIPERYGYKLLSGEKRTKQRDVILRICYAAKMTLDETQRALKLYNMFPLYAKAPRDALLMIAFNERPGDILKVNSFLSGYSMEPLRTSGLQE